MLRGSSAFGAFIPDQYLANYVKKMGIAKYWLKKNIARWNRIGMALVFWIFSRSLRCAMTHAHILHKFLLNESSNFFLDCFLLETHFRGIPYMKNHGMAYAFEKASQWKGSRLRWCSVIYGSMLGKGLMDKQTCFFFFPHTAYCQPFIPVLRLVSYVLDTSFLQKDMPADHMIVWDR